MIRLKTPQPDDLTFIRRLWGNPATMQAVGGAFQLTDDQAARWFERMVNPGRATDLYQLVLNEPGDAVGEISFHRFDTLSRRAELNVKIATWARGKGYGTDAVRQLLPVFFEFGGRELTDDVAPKNEGGRRLLEKLGFEHDPTVKDVYRLRITQGRFKSLTAPKNFG